MLELFTESALLFIAVVFAFCLVVGSFLNVVIYRLPVMMEREWREQCREMAKSPAVAEVPEERHPGHQLPLPQGKMRQLR